MGGSFASGKTSSRFQAKPENGKPHQEQSQISVPAARRLNAGRLLKKGRERFFKTDGGNESPEREISTEPGLWFIVFF